MCIDKRLEGTGVRWQKQGTSLTITEYLDTTSKCKKHKKAISTVCQWLCYIIFNQVFNLKFQTLIILSHPPTLSLSPSPALPLSPSLTLHSLPLPFSINTLYPRRTPLPATEKSQGRRQSEHPVVHHPGCHLNRDRPQEVEVAGLKLTG